MSAFVGGRIGLSMTLTLCALPALAEPLTVVDVAAPAINCVFDRSCQVTVTDSVGAIPIPGISGSAILQSRTFAGAGGAPAAGMVGYEFRVDLTHAVGTAGKVCVTRLKLDVGPPSRLPYPGGGAPAEVFVVTSGGIGTVGLASAERTGDKVTFALRSAVCAGVDRAKGETSYFYGFASTKAPRAVTAQVQLDDGRILDVGARAPGR